jgi:hypothetical protein
MLGPTLPAEVIYQMASKCDVPVAHIKETTRKEKKTTAKGKIVTTEVKKTTVQKNGDLKASELVVCSTNSFQDLRLAFSIIPQSLWRLRHIESVLSGTYRHVQGYPLALETHDDPSP